MFGGVCADFGVEAPWTAGCSQANLVTQMKTRTKNNTQKRHRAAQLSRVYSPAADTLGVAASGLCLVHCVVFSFGALVLPALGAVLPHDDTTHFLLCGFVVAFCLLAVVPGYLHHLNKQVLGLMISGVTLVIFATFAADRTLGEGWEMPLITVGNLLVMTAHIRNRRLCDCSR